MTFVPRTYRYIHTGNVTDNATVTGIVLKVDNDMRWRRVGFNYPTIQVNNF